MLILNIVPQQWIQYINNQFIFEMGNKSTHDIPPMIIKNWYQVSPNQDIFKSKLTQQCVREHFLQILTASQIQEFKHRIKETNPYICRVAFYYPHHNDFYYVYTDENRNNPFVNNREEWKVHQQRIIEAFIILARRYRPTNVCREMIGVDFTGQIKVWINPNPVLNTVWSACSTQGQMIKDVLNICNQIEQESLKKQQTGKKFLKFYKEQAKSTANQQFAKNRFATQNFSNLQMRNKNNSLKQIILPNESKNNKETFKKPSQRKFNFKNISKVKDISAPFTPQPITSSQINPSWDNVKTSAFEEFLTAQNVQKIQETKVIHKQIKKVSKLRKFSSMNTINMEAQCLNLKENDQKCNKFSSLQREQKKEKNEMRKKEKYLQCKTQASSSNQSENYEQSQQKGVFNQSKDLLKLSSSLQLGSLMRQRTIIRTETENIEKMFDEEERKQYLQIQQKIRTQKIRYKDLKSQMSELLRDH